VGDARKKIGGVVFTHGHSGGMIRKKVSPIQPRSQAQRNVRSNFTSLSKGWQALTQAVQAGWVALAKSIVRKNALGQSHSLTGLQLYQSCARNCATVGQAPPATAPASLVATAPGTLSMTLADGGTPAFTITPATYPQANEYAVVMATAPFSPGRVFVGKKYALVFVSAVAPVAPYNILTAYTAKYGAPVTGKKVGVLVKHVNGTTGAAGIPSALEQIST
jgi:hypothetical protein